MSHQPEGHGMFASCEAVDRRVARLLADKKNLRSALISALEWIDAVPLNIILPTMPGFDRDAVDDLLDRTR